MYIGNLDYSSPAMASNVQFMARTHDPEMKIDVSYPSVGLWIR